MGWKINNIKNYKEILFPSDVIDAAFFLRILIIFGLTIACTSQITPLKTQLFIIRMYVTFQKKSKHTHIDILIHLSLGFWLLSVHFWVNFVSIFFPSWSHQSSHNLLLVYTYILQSQVGVSGWHYTCHLHSCSCLVLNSMWSIKASIWKMFYLFYI